MFKLDLERAEEPEIKLPTTSGSFEKQESSRKTSTLASLTTPKPLTALITTNCGNFFKKIRDTKGTFHAKMGTIKDRNGMDLTEAEDIKKRWQEYTEELYKTDLHDSDNRNGVITHIEPDILECKVKWALGSIATNKASGDDGIPVELFQILKEDTVKVLY